MEEMKMFNEENDGIDESKKKRRFYPRIRC